MQYLIVVVLILFSALFSGLTLGLMGLSPQELKRKMSLGDKDAEKVYKVRKNGNLLLTTLLIGNVAVNAALSIFLGSIAAGLTAGLIATGLIVIFGEITPQAIFSRFALELGAKMAWLVRVFIFVLYPIAFPISWVLDKALGSELPTVYSKQELVKIIEEHEDTASSDVREEEERIIKGALTFSEKKVEDVMTPRTVVLALEASTRINEKLLDKLDKAGYTRIPVYEKELDNITGILYMKQLLGNKNLNRPVGEVVDKKVLFVSENENLMNVFNLFLKSRHHLAIARDEFGGIVGIITLEDILEEIIMSEIVDEGDRHEDMRKLARSIARKTGKK